MSEVGPDLSQYAGVSEAGKKIDNPAKGLYGPTPEQAAAANAPKKEGLWSRLVKTRLGQRVKSGYERFRATRAGERVSLLEKKPVIKRAKRGLANAAIAANVLNPFNPMGVGDDIGSLGITAADAASKSNRPPIENQVPKVDQADSTAWRRQFTSQERGDDRLVQAAPPPDRDTSQDSVTNLKKAPEVPKTIKANVNPVSSNRPSAVPNRR
jgi:hypothetical protein